MSQDEGYYRQIVEASTEALWVLGLDGTIRYTNPSMAALLGYSPTELVGRSALDLHDEVGKLQFAAHLVRARAGAPNAEDVECRYLRKDGSHVWALVSESLLRSDDGAVIGLAHRMSDHTERRRLWEELAERGEQLAEAQRVAKLGSWTWDPRSDVISWSRELLRQIGEPDSGTPVTYSAYLARVHPADRKRVDQVVTEVLESGSSFEMDVRLLRPDGGQIWVRNRGEVTRDDAGVPVRLTGTSQDVSDMKATEIALQDALEQNLLLHGLAAAANQASTLMEVLRTAQGAIVAYDDWVRARGFIPDPSSPDGLARLPVTDGEDLEDQALPPGLLDAERALAGRALHTGGLVWDESDPDNPSIAFPILDGGTTMAIAVLTADVAFERHEMIERLVGQVSSQLSRVAERERISAELADARDAALAASRHKSEFLAMMSHEIRTPLNGVIGLNELLLSSGLNAEQRRYAEGVQQSGRALLATINDILDFSKIEAGQLQLESLDFVVRQVVDDAVRLSAPEVLEKDLELVVTVDPDVPERLRGDPTRLTQVLTNLTSNAVKFTESGQVVVNVVSHHDEDGVVLGFTVEDTGIGIDPAVRAVLFEPFVQADLSTTRRHGGTGLGLAISRQIVRALGGEIGVDGTEAGGSRFWFTARFLSADAVDPDRTLVDPVVGMRVIVLDDNAATRDHLHDVLTGWGLEVQTAADHPCALRLLETAAAAGRPPHAVLVDTVMPGDDGLRLIAHLAQDPGSAGIGILILASGPGADLAATLPPAAREAPVVVKPVGQSELLGALRRVLGPDSVPVSAAGPATPAPPLGRILVVEDHEINQLVAVGMLESLGYQTDVASDGATGVERAAQRDFDAILMDVQMPGMDGLTATMRIREAGGTRSRVPIIAMTAGAIDGDRERALAAGMDDFLSKPVSVHALGSMLEQWLGKRDTAEPDPTGDGGASTPPPDAPAAPAVLDPSRLDELDELSSGEGMSYVDVVVDRFVARGSEPAEELAAVARDGDHTQVRALAHRLKGNSANLGLIELAELAAHIEQLGADEQPATEESAELGAAFERATEALTSWQRARADRTT